VTDKVVRAARRHSGPRRARRQREPPGTSSSGIAFVSATRCGKELALRARRSGGVRLWVSWRRSRQRFDGRRRRAGRTHGRHEVGRRSGRWQYSAGANYAAGHTGAAL